MLIQLHRLAISPRKRHSHKQGLAKVVLARQVGVHPLTDLLFLHERDSHIDRDLLKTS
jgi:hypothetical protein